MHLLRGAPYRRRLCVITVVRGVFSSMRAWRATKSQYITVIGQASSPLRVPGLRIGTCR
jgi:hypothetical protein